MSPLGRRLLDCVPLLDYGLEAFLGLFEIEETREIPTAAVPLGKSPRLLINPDFVAASCPTQEDLAALVLHEMHHLLLGHTRLFQRVTQADNVAFDAVINAMLCRRHPEPARTAFFRRLYRADVFPELLLRPPEGFPGKPRWSRAVEPAWRAMLKDLYYTGTGTFHEVYALLRERLAPAVAITLLGSHGDDEQGLDASDDPALFAAVRQVVERWPMPPDPRIGRSLENALRTLTVKIATHPPHAVLRCALLAAAREGNRHVGRFDRSPVTVDVAWPTRDRRAFALGAFGAPPLLNRGEIVGRPRPAGITPVDIYVDVSASVAGFLPHLLAAIRSCRAWVAPRMFQFSCGVEELTLADLTRGRVRTTGGTDGAIFTRHLSARAPGSAVVLTDGYVGAIPAGDIPACRRARLQVVLTPKGWRQDLAPVASAFHQLELT